MKKRHTCCLFLAGLACVALTLSALVASADAANDAEMGQLTINRLPSLGGNIGAFILIDGVSVSRIGWGQSYQSLLAPGEHLISITVYPNHLFQGPAEKRVSVQSGQRYMLTLQWNGDHLILR